MTARRCVWKGYEITMDHPWNAEWWNCREGVPCDINQWIRSDDLDTGFLFCDDCARTGVTPDEFYAARETGAPAPAERSEDAS